METGTRKYSTYLDFTKWKDHDGYMKACTWLLCDLKVETPYRPEN